MTGEKLVSVAMAVYKPHPVYFPEAVRSVLEQTYGNLELVIVEDPSDQPAADLLRQFADTRIRHHCNPVRTGQAAQRNLALSLARSDLVAVADADDVCYPDRIEKQLAFLPRQADVTVLGGQLEIIGDSGETIGWRRYPVNHRTILACMPRFNPIAQPAALFRRAVVLSAGGYQRDIVGDYDLWSRLARAGTVFANCPEPLVRYRIHPGAIKARSLRASIRATHEVKRLYWHDQMDWAARARLQMERALLWLPPMLVLRLFQSMQYSRRRPVFGDEAAS